MAQQKISFLKLGLKKNTNLIELPWEDQIIEIKEYLPIKDKMNLIDKIFNQSVDNNSNIANIMQTKINITLEVVFAYTNINFTEKQKKDKLELYDLLISSGVWQKIADTLNNTPTKELDTIESYTQEMINEFYRYKDSVLGIIDTVNSDYTNVNLDVNEIQEKLNDTENLSLLKDVVTKLG